MQYSSSRDTAISSVQHVVLLVLVREERREGLIYYQKKREKEKGKVKDTSSSELNNSIEKGINRIYHSNSTFIFMNE